MCREGVIGDAVNQTDDDDYTSVGPLHLLRRAARRSHDHRAGRVGGWKAGQEWGATLRRDESNAAACASGTRATAETASAA